MKQVFAEAFEFTNVKGNKLKYLRLKNEVGEHVINVGEETFKKVSELQGKEAELPLTGGNVIQTDESSLKKGKEKGDGMDNKK